MATIESSELAAELADLEEVCRNVAARRTCNADLLQRIGERAEKVKHDLYRTYGPLNIAVDLVREIRDEE